VLFGGLADWNNSGKIPGSKRKGMRWIACKELEVLWDEWKHSSHHLSVEVN
jgi:hypothetical protein